MKWQGETFHIKSLRAKKGSKISMLGVPGELKWRQDENGISIEYPSYKSLLTQCAYAWVFKIKLR